MNSLDNTVSNRTSCLPSIITPRTVGEKYVFTIIASAILAIAIIGSAYGIGGFTSLAQTWHIWPNFNPILSSFITIVSIITLAAAVTFLIVIHKKTPQEKNGEVDPALQQITQMQQEHKGTNPQTKNVDPAFQQAFNNVEGIIENSAHLQQVKHIINSGCASYLDHYGFYYHLSSVTKEVIEHPEKKQQWAEFLSTINGKKIYHRVLQRDITIDSSIELAKIEGRATKLVIEELNRKSSRITEELEEIRGFCSEAFPDGDTFRYGDLKTYFFEGKQERRRPFVVRDNETRKILGVIVLEDVDSTLYIHTLARSAQAVRLGLTEQLKEFILPKINLSTYRYVWCEVLKNNKPAQYIYQSLGFVFAEEKEDCYVMHYKPHA